MIKRNLIMTLVFCILVHIWAGVTTFAQGKVIAQTKQDVMISSPERESFIVKENGRYRLMLMAQTSENSGVSVFVYKNENFVWMQYIPEANSGTVDVRTLASKNDKITFSITPDEEKTAMISYNYEITKYDGSLPINETAGNQGDNFKTVESTTLLDYIKNSPTNGTRLYAIYNDKEFPMVYSAQKNYWNVNVLKAVEGNNFTSNVYFRLNEATADLGGWGGSPNVEIPITKDGMIHIKGKIPGIAQWYNEHDVVLDENGNLISGYYSQNYAGVCTTLYKNGKTLWSSRVGDSSVRFDEEYDTSYFCENIDVVTRVKTGDVLRFSFDGWRKFYKDSRNNPFKADISNVIIDYIGGNPVSSVTEKKVDTSLVFNLYTKQLTKNQTVIDADIVFKDGEAYLASGEVYEIFGEISGVDEHIRNGVVYQNLSETIINAGMNPVMIDDRLMIAHEGISGQYSYSEISRLESAFCGNLIMNENGEEIEISNLPDKVWVYSKIKEGVLFDKNVKIYLVGYRDNMIVWLDVVSHELKAGDTVVSKIIELENTQNYDGLRVFIWDEKMSPIIENIA